MKESDDIEMHIKFGTTIIGIHFANSQQDLYFLDCKDVNDIHCAPTLHIAFDRNEPFLIALLELDHKPLHTFGLLSFWFRQIYAILSTCANQGEQKLRTRASENVCIFSGYRKEGRWEERERREKRVKKN